nr:TetR/AcrR family transcriptional regulator C-terminal domain-containing protein [Cohnella sp. REN36]
MRRLHGAVQHDLAENICGKLRLPDPELSWEAQVLSFAREYRTVLLSVRDAAEILLETPPLLPKRLLFMESMLRNLVEAGFPPEEIVMAAMLVNDYVLSFVKNETRDFNPPEEETGPPNDFFGRLSPEQYPTLFRLAPYLMQINTEEHFEYGLQMLLGSLRQRLKDKPSGTSSND